MRAHGSRARYVHGPDENDQPGKPCHCGECRKANTTAQAAKVKRDILIDLDLAEPVLVDAEPARRHVQKLRTQGIGWKRIAVLAGVSRGSVEALLHGRGSRPPSVKIRPDTSRKLLAVRPAAEAFAGNAFVDGAGTRRRVQALVCLGWSLAALAPRIGWNRTNLAHMLASPGPVTAATARLVDGLYGELSMTVAPDSPSATRARRMAEGRKWVPPLGWDDDLIDLPEADLEAELARRVEQMDDYELSSCWTAYYKHGDQSPLIVAAARARKRYLNQKNRSEKKASAA